MADVNDQIRREAEARNERFEERVREQQHAEQIEAAFARGVREGIEKGDSRTTIVGICGVAAVALGLIAAIWHGHTTASLATVEQTRIACTGDLTEPARAIACAFAAERKP